MERYPKLVETLPGPRGAPNWTRTVDYLLDVWVGDYGDGDLITTEASGFSYLFDVAEGRLIAAWGLSRGKHHGVRDKARMAGAPLGMPQGSGYHRGHAIPHSLGGPTDINLVPQRGSVNVGPFRELEIQAVARPGALYFTRWLYGGLSRGRMAQVPTAIDQGLLVPGELPRLKDFVN